MKATPCTSCPFRIGNTADIIPGYDQCKADGLMNCVGEGDGFRPVMACHHSKEGADFACRGYLAQEGDSNIVVRLLASTGSEPSPREVRDACAAAGIELETDYPTVLRKLSAGTN